MLGLVSGRVMVLTERTVILEAGGVGWELTCAPALLQTLEVGSQATLYCEVRASENDLSLVGFASLRAREIFRKLRTAPGVGTAGALALLGSFPEQQLIAYVLAGDAKALTSAPGIGQRRAEQIIAALRDSFAELAEPTAGETTTGGQDNFAGLRGAALSALISLGYTTAQAEGALRKTAPSFTSTESPSAQDREDLEDFETRLADWVRRALQELAQS